MAIDAEKKAIGKRIRDARKRAGLSQSELATAIGVQSQSVYRYEAGRLRPSAASAVGLAQALGVTERWLMQGGEDAIRDARGRE